MQNLSEPHHDRALTEAISAAIVALYATFDGHDRTTATAYINDNIVVCPLEGILTAGESRLVADGPREEVIDGCVAFQADTQGEFTGAVGRLTRRRVTAFLSADRAGPGVDSDVFFLEAAPPSGATQRQP